MLHAPVTRRVCIRCGTLQAHEPGKPCGACGASSFGVVPVRVAAYAKAGRADLWPGAGEDERDYSPETP